MNARNALHVALLAAAAAWALPAFAHCDTLDGPVVESARHALATGKVEPALIWVRPQDERAIRDAYGKARAARAAGGAAAEKAEMAFYGDLVRIHREGEGAPFTGLKPAGQVDPALVVADRALASGKLADVEAPLVSHVRSGLAQRFTAASTRRNFDPMDVASGRAYVGAYVDYVHYVERVHEAAAPAEDEASPHGAGHAPAAPHAH